jgi:ketosteroid isomerase-like protein
MRFPGPMIIAVASSICLMAQDPAGELRKELEAVHARWFRAFDGGDGATMDELEMSNLILVMPDGTIFSKSKPRAGNQSKRPTEHALTDVSVRRFGDAAVLTGLLNTTSANGQIKEATTVLFVQNDGRWKIASAQWTTSRK